MGKLSREQFESFVVEATKRVNRIDPAAEFTCSDGVLHVQLSLRMKTLHLLPELIDDGNLRIQGNVLSVMVGFADVVSFHDETTDFAATFSKIRAYIEKHKNIPDSHKSEGVKSKLNKYSQTPPFRSRLV